MVRKNKGSIKVRIQKEPFILPEASQSIPKLCQLFEKRNFDWMENPLDKYNAEVAHECYANYVATLEIITPLLRYKYIGKYPGLDLGMVQSLPVDIS